MPPPPTFDPDDKVYRDYIPAGVTRTLTPTELEEMSPPELSQYLQDLKHEAFNKRVQEDSAKLQAYPGRFKDASEERLYLAFTHGDRFLTEEIIQRDEADTVTGRNPSDFPTQTQTGIKSRADIYRILCEMSDDFKQALLCNDPEPLIADGLRKSTLHIHSTPAKLSTPISLEDREPVIYCLYLGATGGVHPTAHQLGAILYGVDDYIHDIRIAPGRKPERPHRMSAAMENIYKIEAASGKSKRNLTKAKFDQAVRDGASGTACKYVNTSTDKANIAKTVRLARNWLNQLLSSNFNRTAPLPWTLTSVGWTCEPAKRRSDYESHYNVGFHITIFDAVARALDQGFQLHWRVLFKPTTEATVKMSEHVSSVLNSSYISMTGLNIVAGGGSNDSEGKIMASTYNRLRDDVTRRPHFKQNATKLAEQIIGERNAILQTYALDEAMTTLHEKRRKLEEAKKELQKVNSKNQKENIKFGQALNTFVTTAEPMVAAYRERQQVLAGLNLIERQYREKAHSLNMTDLVVVERARDERRVQFGPRMDTLRRLMVGQTVDTQRPPQYAMVMPGHELPDVVDLSAISSSHNSSRSRHPEDSSQTIKSERMSDDEEEEQNTAEEDAVREEDLENLRRIAQSQPAQEMEVDDPAETGAHTQGPPQSVHEDTESEESESERPRKPRGRRIHYTQDESPSPSRTPSPPAPSTRQTTQSTRQSRIQSSVSVVIPVRKKIATQVTKVAITRITDVVRGAQSRFVVTAIMSDGTEREFEWSEVSTTAAYLLGDWEYRLDRAGGDPRRSLPFFWQRPNDWRPPADAGSSSDSDKSQQSEASQMSIDTRASQEL